MDPETFQYQLRSGFCTFLKLNGTSSTNKDFGKVWGEIDEKEAENDTLEFQIQDTGSKKFNTARKKH